MLINTDFVYIIILENFMKGETKQNRRVNDRKTQQYLVLSVKK